MSGSPRILFVNRMASMVRGGGETFDLEMARELEQLSTKTCFLTGIPLLGRALVPIVHFESFTIRSPYTGWLRWDRIPGGWRLRMFDFYLFEKAAARWIMKRQADFDIIQACELPYLVHFLKQFGCRLPVSMRLTAPDYHDPVGAVRQADQVIASGDTMEKMRQGERPDCVDVPNGVDVDRFQPGPSKLKERLGLTEEQKVILFVARFQSVKNHGMLVEAFSRAVEDVPGAILVLAGSGPFRTKVEEQVKASGLTDKVRFLGEVAYDQLPEIYAGADIKVISSDYESFCFAALEGMAAGLPFVVTKTNWVPRLIVDGEGGFVVPVGDADAFSRGLIQLLKDDELRQGMGARNRREAENRWGWKNSARKLLRSYRDCLEKAS